MKDIITWSDAIEWESIDEGFEFEILEKGPLPISGTCQLSRGNGGELIGVVTTDADAGPWMPSGRHVGRRGEFLEPAEPVTGKGAGRRLRLTGVRGVKSTIANGSMTTSFSAQAVEMRYRERDRRHIKHVSIWCVGGPGNHDLGIMFPVERTRRTYCTRKWFDHETRFRETRARGMTDGAIRLPGSEALGAAEVALVLPPDPVRGRLPGAIGLHFEPLDPASQPSREAVDDYIEALGFSMGRRIAALGWQGFDKKFRTVVGRFHELIPELIPFLRRQHGQPPIPMPTSMPSMVPTPELGLLVNQVQTASRSVNLTDAVWRQWLSDEASLEVQAPLLHAAIEGLADAWIKAGRSDSGGVWISEATWSQFLLEIGPIFERTLGAEMNAGRVRDALSRVNQIGSGQRVWKLFEELGLQTGRVERAALRARHGQAHGARWDPRNARAYIQHVSALRTLLNRVILAIVGWKGQYVDYSTYGYPGRELREPLGGPAGDGVPAA